MKVRFAEPAESDLERLADAIACTDPKRAREFAERVRDAAKAMALTPMRYPPVPSNPRLRKKSVRPYVLIFEIRGDHILLVRIAHERSDWVSLV